MNNFSRLCPDIILTHILPRLGGETLIVLSSVSSEFRHMICNDNEDLWWNTCTSTWPSLLCIPIQKIISKFFSGYRSFFSDAFPAIHHRNHYTPPPQEYSFICLFHVCLQGEREPLFASIDLNIIKECYPDVPYKVYSKYDSPWGNLNFKYMHVKEEGCEEYLKENLRLSWVVIETHQKRAGSLFCSSVKPVSVEHVSASLETKVVYETMMPGLSEDYTEMVKCKVKVTCHRKGGDDGFYVNNLELQMKDMNGKSVWEKHGTKVLLNVIENGERKKKER